MAKTAKEPTQCNLFIGLHVHRHGTSGYLLAYDDTQRFIEEVLKEDWEGEEAEEYVEIIGPLRYPDEVRGLKNGQEEDQ